MKDVASFVKGSWFDSIDLSRIGLHCGFRTRSVEQNPENTKWNLRILQSENVGKYKVKFSDFAK